MHIKDTVSLVMWSLILKYNIPIKLEKCDLGFKYYLIDKGASSQGHGFPSGCVWMWELELKNWCFWTVVLEKTLASPLGCKEIQPVHPKGGQSWVFIGRTDAEAETPILWYLMRRADSLEKTLMLGGIGGQKENGMTEDEMAGWHHRLDAHEFGWIPGVGDGQGGLACCSPWGCKESDRTEQVKWTELNWTESIKQVSLNKLCRYLEWL